ISSKGDLNVDFHHTVEDTGITLGSAISQALGDKRSIQRYGWIYLPMDEALARVVLDCSGRPFLRFSTIRDFPPVGQFPFQLVEEFSRALATNAAITLHIDLLEGRDSHHAAEAIFKGIGRALRMAIQFDPFVPGIPSTKGSL
ncbi:MAG: imidazoleglycerol-phosphate dehydratase, partial [Chthoniobacterales bacterium]|nr:imidazoleglycerol-phosphate dehydratase [Chthoniobacterales bacterium]